jgi:hypothetical protein
MPIDEKGMGFDAFRRFRKTWLRGERCQEDINNLWTGHQPETISELYSRMEFELDPRLAAAENIGIGLTVPSPVIAPNCQLLGIPSTIISISFHRPASLRERCRQDRQMRLAPSARIFLPTDVPHGLRQFRRTAL